MGDEATNVIQCHTHPKIKDAPKRRRESSHQRLAASTTARPKVEPGQSLPQAQNPITPQMTPSSMTNSSTTPTTSHHVTSHPQQHEHEHQHQDQYQQSMVPPPAPPHLQIQVSSPMHQRDNPMDNITNMI